MAVIETNYEVRADYQNLDFGDAYRVDGRLTLPLLRYGGASFFSGYGRFKGDNRFIDSDSYTVGGEVFIRDYKVGKLSAQFRYRNTELDIPDNVVNVNDSITTKNYRALGEYYYRAFTLSVSRNYLNNEKVDNVKSWRGSGIAYINDNTRLRVFGNHSDNKTNYGFSVAHQPSVFRNSTQISLSYSDSGNNNDIYSVSLAYYFDKRPSLIDRDRKYR